ncbi:MAG: 2Fe-2S iron-sulfur cluster-binding protein [Candidatus Absconditabacterales bacterium]|nr:2Fe-2S iron-sulfur cluster-binding protein [Candidatus Absconditabacterales bacterium]
MSQTTITVLNADGSLCCSFAGVMGESLAQQANNHGANIPLACCAGACSVCACYVLEGRDNIDHELLGTQLTTLDTDDQICSCIAGIKPGNSGSIVIKKGR